MRDEDKINNILVSQIIPSELLDYYMKGDSETQNAAYFEILRRLRKYWLLQIKAQRELSL